MIAIKYYYRYCFSFSLVTARKLPQAYICRTYNASRIGCVVSEDVQLLYFIFRMILRLSLPYSLTLLALFHMSCSVHVIHLFVRLVQSTSINFIHIFKVHMAVVTVLFNHEMSVSLHDGTMGGIVNVSYLLRHHYWFFERFYSSPTLIASNK